MVRWFHPALGHRGISGLADTPPRFISSKCIGVSMFFRRSSGQEDFSTSLSFVGIQSTTRLPGSRHQLRLSVIKPPHDMMDR
jgi:hypothetical protein